MHRVHCRVVQVAQLHVFVFCSPALCCPMWLSHKNDVRLVYAPICIIGSLCFICYLYLFTYTGVQPRFPFHMMFVPFNRNMTCGTRGAGRACHAWAPEFTLAFVVFFIRVVFRISLFVFFPNFLVATILSVLRFMASDYPFGTF